MSYLSMIVIGAVLLALDVSLGGLLTLRQIRPSLTLPFVVYVGLQRGPISGTIAGAGMGLMQDVLGSLPLGATSFSYGVVGFACGKLWSGGATRVFWPWGVFLLTSGLLTEAFAVYLISRGIRLDFLPLYVTSGIPAAAYTTVLGLLWFLSPLHRERKP